MASQDAKILEFDQDQKSGKALFIIYGDLNAYKKRLMDVKIILKIHLQPLGEIFHRVFQCLQYRHLKA